MNTHEITELGRRLVTGLMVFHGAFAADTFIEALNFNNTSTEAYIVNTEHSQSRGRHWVAIIQDPGGRVEFFDPLGHGPWEYANLNIFNAVAFNSNELQNPLTNTSGHISLLYLYFRSRGYSFRYTIKWFKSLFIEFGSISIGVLVILTAIKLHFHIREHTIEQM